MREVKRSSALLSSSSDMCDAPADAVPKDEDTVVSVSPATRTSPWLECAKGRCRLRRWLWLRFSFTVVRIYGLKAAIDAREHLPQLVDVAPFE